MFPTYSEFSMCSIGYWRCLFRQTCRNVACKRGWHKNSSVLWYITQNTVVFSRHCIHCGKYEICDEVKIYLGD